MRDDFGQNGGRDLGRCHRSDRQADRSANAGQRILGNTHVAQQVEAPRMGTARSQSADIKGWCAQDVGQHACFIVMIVREQHRP
jgi:hypothetical protein